MNKRIKASLMRWSVGHQASDGRWASKIVLSCANKGGWGGLTGDEGLIGIYGMI